MESAHLLELTHGRYIKTMFVERFYLDVIADDGIIVWRPPLSLRTAILFVSGVEEP